MYRFNKTGDLRNFAAHVNILVLKSVYTPRSLRHIWKKKVKPFIFTASRSFGKNNPPMSEAWAAIGHSQACGPLRLNGSRSSSFLLMDDLFAARW